MSSSHINRSEASRIIVLSVENAAELGLSEELPAVAERLLIKAREREIGGVGPVSIADFLYKLGRYLVKHEAAYPHKWNGRS